MRIDSLRRKVLRGLLVIGLVTAGSTAVVASPALAIGACQNAGFPISACIDFGSYGNQARADFYMNGSLGDSLYTYRVYIYVNGVRFTPLGGNSGRLNHQGRFCCWYVTTDSTPDSLKRVQTRVEVYRIDGSYNYTASSPIIEYIR
jgi:hypothetical protein